MRTLSKLSTISSSILFLFFCSPPPPSSGVESFYLLLSPPLSPFFFPFLFYSLYELCIVLAQNKLGMGGPKTLLVTLMLPSLSLFISPSLAPFFLLSAPRKSLTRGSGKKGEGSKVGEEQESETREREKEQMSLIDITSENIILSTSKTVLFNPFHKNQNRE